MNELTQKRLKELLHYDPETGIFTRIVGTGNQVKVGDIAGSYNDQGYILINIDGRKYRAHRLAFLFMEGKFPPAEVDHINHIKDDNCWNNLRHSSRTENCRNMSIMKNNTSGVSGVSWDKSRNKWESFIWGKNKKIFLGYFKDWFEAVCSRKSAENKRGYHENHGASPCLK